MRGVKKKSTVGDYIRERGGLFVSGGFDVLFFALLLLIIVIGLIMLYSSTFAYAYYTTEDGDTAYYFKKQLFFVIIGFIAMMFISHLNYNVFKEIGAWLGTIGSWGLLVVALLMPAHNNTHRHIYIGNTGIQFQPSDIAKFALILTLAMLLDEYHDTIVSKKPLNNGLGGYLNGKLRKPVFSVSTRMIIICGVIIMGYAGLVFLGSHLSGTLLMLGIGITLLYLGEVNAKWFVGGFAGVGAALFVAYESGLLKEYMEERITAWLDKDFEPLGARWQINQALYAIGSGGLFGKGLGQSTLKHMYVSEPQNDMIFSIVVEELGFLGAALIIILFALLIWRGVVIGINAENRYGALIAMGVVFQLGLQVVLNIAVATDSVPNTGISLPFFSYGGTAICMQLVEMGFVLSISRTSKIKRRLSI